MIEKEKAGPDDYKLIFEDNLTGQKILDDLIQRFSYLPPKSGGLDRVLNQFEYAGQRRVIDFIALRVDQANNKRMHNETIEIE